MTPDVFTLIPFSAPETQRCSRRAETCIARNDEPSPASTVLAILIPRNGSPLLCV